MDIFAVGGNSIYFTTLFFKLIIVVCQILQFCGTYKCKVCRIKEKQTPLPDDIFLCYGTDGTVFIGLYRKRL